MNTLSHKNVGIYLECSQINDENIYIFEPVKNNVISGYFSRVLFVTPLCTLNGLYIWVPLVNTTLDANCRDFSSSAKTSFDFSENVQICNALFFLEGQLLSIYSAKHPTRKTQTRSLQQQLTQGWIRALGYVSSNVFILKISGVWETHTQYGITFKFIPYHNKTDAYHPSLLWTRRSES